MKAYVLHGINDLRWDEVARPIPEKGTVLVKVAAAGICGSDIPRIYHTGAHRHPLIPGHEFAGTVVEVAEDTDWELVGKRVGIFPLIPCMECPQCQKKQYEMCNNYSYLGSRTDGGFAEYVQVPVWNLLPLPDEVTFEQAAMLEPTSVAFHAVRAMQVTKEDTVAICGLGTIGLLVAMHLKSMGVGKILLIGNKKTQKAMAGKFGISEEDFCDTRIVSPKEWIMEKTNGNGVTVFFECVGKNEIVQLALDTTAAGGRVMLVGNPASDICLEKNIYWKILRRQLTLKGTWNSSFLREKTDDWNLVVDGLKTGSIHPEILITHTFSLDKLKEGMEIMRDKSEEYVKVMGKFDE